MKTENKQTINGTTAYSTSGTDNSQRPGYHAKTEGRQRASSESTTAFHQQIHVDNTKERFTHAKTVALEGARFARNVGGAFTHTSANIARSEETGTVRQIDNLNEARRFAVSSVKAAQDVPRQIGNIITVGRNAVDVGRYLMGKETKGFHELKTKRSLIKKEKSGLTLEDQGDLGRFGQKNINKNHKQIDAKINKLNADNKALDKVEADLRKSGKGTDAQFASIRKQRESNSKKIDTLNKIKSTREQARNNYGDLSKIKRISKAKHIRNNTERKIRKAQYNSVGGRRNYHQIKSLEAELERRTKSFDELRSKASHLKKEINFLKNKNNLSSDEIARLKNLTEKKLSIQNSLKENAHKIKDIKNRMSQIGSIASRESLLSSSDKSRLSLLNEKISRKKALKKIKKGKEGRRGLRQGMFNILSRAARDSEENGVQSIVKASRLVQKRYVRTTLKFFIKITLAPAKFVGKKIVVPLASFTAKKIDSKLGVSNSVREVKNKILHSKPAANVRKVSNKISHRASKRRASKAGQSTKKTFTAAKKALGSFAKLLSSKTRVYLLLLVGGALVFVALISAIINIIGGLVSALIPFADTGTSGKLDFTPLAQEMETVQLDWSNEINGLANQCMSQYGDVVITMSKEDKKDAEKTREKLIQIISMATVCADWETNNLHLAYDHLFRHVFSYSVDYTGSTKYCEGCETEIYFCEGCQPRPASGGQAFYCPDGHEVTYCSGHTAPVIQLFVVPLNDIYELDNQCFNSQNEPFNYSSSFQGWDENSIEQVRLYMDGITDKYYSGLENLDNFNIFEGIELNE